MGNFWSFLDLRTLGTGSALFSILQKSMLTSRLTPWLRLAQKASNWSSTIAAISFPKFRSFSACTSVARLANIERPPDVTGVVGDFDVSKTLSLAEQLQPNARKLVVIAGAGPFDLQWAHIARKQLAPQEKKFETRYLVGLTREAILQELSKLSRDTIVILLTVFRDGAGKLVPGDLTAEFVRASKADLWPLRHEPWAWPCGGAYDILRSSGQ